MWNRMAKRAVCVGLVMAWGLGFGALAEPAPNAGEELLVRQVVVPVPNTYVVLHGEIKMPPTAGPHRALLLVTGNGPHTREQTVSGCPTFRYLSDYLALHGIATMVVDSRGHGYSQGPSELETTTEDRAADANACLDVLKKQAGIDPKRIGILGHSEGAMIAMMVAAERDDLSCVIALSSPGRATREIWIEQKLNGLRARGVDEEKVTAVRGAFEEFTAMAARGFASDEEYYEAGKNVLRAHGVAGENIANQLVDNVLSDLREPWYRYFLGWEPRGYVEKIDAPMMALWGELDDQTPPVQNMALFEEVKKEGGHKDWVIEVLPGEDHFFLTRNDHTPGEKHDYGRMWLSEPLMIRVQNFARQAMP